MAELIIILSASGFLSILACVVTRLSSARRRVLANYSIDKRDRLLRAIAGVQQASSDLLTVQEYLDELNNRSPSTVDENTGKAGIRTYAISFHGAMSNLRAQIEICVSDSNLRGSLYELDAYIGSQVKEKINKPDGIHILSALGYFGRIASRIRKVTQEIDDNSD